MKQYLSSKFTSYLKEFFVNDEKGAIAIIFVVMLIPILALAGAAVDYTNASDIKTQMQKSADTAALAAGRAFSQNIDADGIEEITLKIFEESMVSLGHDNNVAVEIIHIEDGVRIEADTIMKTSFLKLLGSDTLNIGVFSEVLIGANKLEVVLVLDNTSSMRGSKLRSLKDSAKQLVEILMTHDTGGSVDIGLVPFNRYVNIGMSNRNEPGIDVPADYSVPRSDYCRNTYPNSTRRCDRRRETYSCSRDGIPSTCSRWRYFNCRGSRGAPVYVCTPRSPSNYRWNGCVGSRDYPLNIRDEDYSTDEVPGLIKSWNFCRVNPLTRLTNTKASIIRALNSMNARDLTYIPAGLIWGWRLLSKEKPFIDASPYGEGITKVLVLMTDGNNTKSPNYPWHDRSNANQANNITEELCENILEENIVVYTIAFDVSNNSIKTILQDCAGNGGSYFDADDAAELEETFNSIAKELADLRISR